MLSFEFVVSWGEVQKAIGGLIALVIGDENAVKHFQRSQKAGKGAILQQYWYARWMVRHGLFVKGADKAGLEDELAEICIEIKKKRRQPRVHDVRWFASMVERNKGDPESWVLKTTFSRINRTEIQRMLNNRLIPLSALPPLSVEEFPPIGGYVP